MTGGLAERYDFFLSRRGSVAAIAREVTDVLLEKGYKVRVEDYDFRLGTSFIEEMHEAIIRSRGLIILFTEDYLRLPYTRKEFTSFEAQRLRSPEERHVAILRCEDAPLEGLLADVAYQNLVGVVDPDERRRRIIAAAERQSQSAPPPPPPRPFMGVPPRIASFTGRAHDLTRLDAILMQERSAAVTQAVGRAAIQGMGGVGKTSLVVEYAHRYRKLYAGVCWCPAETRTGLLSALASLAVALGAARPEEADVDSAAKAALRRLAEQHATWLLVYDNVTAPDHVADLLPSAGARVLITSRFSDWGEVADEVALDVLPLEEAVALLQGRTARSDAAGARMLAEALRCLPLALDHAAAYCRRSQMRFADYAKKASSIISTVPRGAGYPRSVAATFDLAITEAVVQCQTAEALLAYLSQCAPERIPMTLVEGAVEDEAERMKALAALAEVSLLKQDPFEDGTPAVTVHRLVQAVALARSEAKGSAQDARGRLTARLVAIYPEDEPSKDPHFWPLCSQLTPHLLALREARSDAVSDITDWANLLDRAVVYLNSRAAYSQAMAVVRDVLAICEKVLGPEHPLTAESLNNLAVMLHSQGDFAAARPLYERALAVREKVLGPEHPHTTESLNTLANLLHSQGDFAAAQPLYERALAVREKVHSRSMSAHWRSARRYSAPSIPIRRGVSTTSQFCSGSRTTLQRRGRSSSAHWRSWRRRVAGRIQTPIAHVTICLAYCY
jgi:tetratricopeptide (TPR) repeat protein